MPPTGTAPFPTAMGMVDGVHRNAANFGTLPEMPRTAGLAQLLVGIVGIGNRAHRRPALLAHRAHLTRGEPKLCVAAIPADILRVGSAGPRQLAAAAGLHLHAMHDGSDRHVAQRQGHYPA